MGLTSGSLICLLFGLTVALVAGAVWKWPHDAGSALRTWLSRAWLLVSSHVVLALAVLVAINAHFLFFSTWDELMGTGGGDVGSVRLETHGGSGPNPPGTAPLGRGKRISEKSATAAMTTGRKISSPHPEVNGDLEKIVIHGVTSGISSEAYVQLPPQYFQPAYARTRFPTVVMLTGYPGNPRALLHVMHFPGMVRAGEKSGKVQPMIYIMMRPTVAPPRDTECTDVPGGPQVETFFGQDLPHAITHDYRASTSRSGWAMMGDSTGGYCAAKVVMRHSDTFSSAVSLSGYFHSLKDLTTGDLYGGSQALRNENDLIWRIKNLPPAPISLLVTSCMSGEKTYPQAMQFLGAARAPMRTDTIILPSGGHNFQTFGRMVPGALEWLSNQLRGG